MSRPARRRSGRGWLRSSIHLTVMLALVVTLLSACGSSLNVKETYPLESVSGSGSQTSYVYRAAGETVQEVATALEAKKKPEQVSKDDPEHMFLVYSDQIIHVQKDPNKPEDSLIEVDSKEYVRQNYSPSFLEGYLLASLIGNLFDSSRGGYYGDYRGYGNQKSYPPTTGSYRTPTVSDQKVAPPLTVDKKGSIFKRGSKSDSGSSVGSDGLFGKKKPTTGSITRDGTSGSKGKSGSSFKPRKTTKPRTSFGGSGRIRRR
ncbi:DUF4247 domain-containing protein [Cohnella hashimotonis]|uniref:DUF4247 domain-containing protein n=1 Tax=Cohnella hashimotonis TaxID=2826895 RepID=A0ABT6TTR1_9BACL|nr:DUF4247 domain-containing protein [Cohnella hashimotonis]MDI4650246.1 DUF4247 domain-containing protein [Cohnella hashimotonis]